MRIRRDAAVREASGYHSVTDETVRDLNLREPFELADAAFSIGCIMASCALPDIRSALVAEKRAGAWDHVVWTK